MEDEKIIDLYWERDEAAIQETSKKYGAYCHSIAQNLLSVREDAQECVNDTWLFAWNQIPPQRPARLRVWLGTIVRNISISMWRKNHAKKRYSGMEAVLDELDECIADHNGVERQIEAAALGEAIDAWLGSLQQEERIIFMRRYWHGVPLKELAKEQNISAGKLAQQMYRLRQSLKAALEKEGIYI